VSRARPDGVAGGARSGSPATADRYHAGIEGMTSSDGIAMPTIMVRSRPLSPSETGDR
jgi:hypothetical protein